MIPASFAEACRAPAFHLFCDGALVAASRGRNTTTWGKMGQGGSGFTVWLTGLSGAGKSTIGHALAAELELRGSRVEVLDGDVVRAHLSRGLGFSREDRDTNIERIGWVASRLTRHGAAVVVAAISPYRETRSKARDMVSEYGSFVEVWVKASVEECARRDVKGLYAKALAGEIDQFTGVSDPYEPPNDAEVVADTARETPEESVSRVLAALEGRGLIPGEEPGAARVPARARPRLVHDFGDWRDEQRRQMQVGGHAPLLVDIRKDPLHVIDR